MDFEYDTQELAWRDEVRAFLAANLTDEVRAEQRTPSVGKAGPASAAFRARVGELGWYGLNWPAEHGGLGLGAMAQHILVNEFDYAGAPPPDLTVTSVAPIIMRFGTPENRADFLPGIASGEIVAAVGYSEPDAGSDLASLSTSAVLDGDEWVINGSKIWNSNAHHATHEWLCVRTDPEAPKHRGISVIMVPIDAPGVAVRPLITWADYRTNITFFDNVRVPKRNLIGEPNKGWQYITGALTLERGALTSSGDLRRVVDEFVAHCCRPDETGARLIDRPDVQRRLAIIEAEIEVTRLLGLEAASLTAQRRDPTMSVTCEKVYSSEMRQRIADQCVQLLGMAGQLTAAEPEAPMSGAMEQLYRAAPLRRFGGGTNEVLRDVIAQRGHGLPSSRKPFTRPEATR
ncbi:acyl-CoA dehydrogenase family protein [Dactylosporangium roseum]|uniref:Acyl-CoA dehydrogenase family protein n=1 Tax=Dactylosporangium roseum TaxID=47989 RepID=A0ABY5YXF4_9ACTN|nr:acyl-CoA dehydrogenase family protein [Dactylosporangium roseum]UWZ34433.1 acyl-CoA dehydrogenase family protein [Dactylosporangium roseum]